MPVSTERHRSMVYFVRSKASGLIKIGTSRRLGTRVAALRGEAGSEVELLGVVQGGLDTEDDIHAMFQQHRVKGEWFKPHAELMAHIAVHAAPGLSQIRLEIPRKRPRRYWEKVNLRIHPKLLREFRIRAIQADRSQQAYMHEILCKSLGREDLLAEPAESAPSPQST